MSEKNRKLFTTPFSAEYWRLAVLEMKSVHMLVIAALLTALRIAIKSAKIPVGPDLTITFGFVVNALGSM
ncbi:MAG: folate family ECF transporter S component, partial [Clostridia bacterium]|nr:folate family ECF transporter S component [Clostridia bacterium]